MQVLRTLFERYVAARQRLAQGDEGKDEPDAEDVAFLRIDLAAYIAGDTEHSFASRAEDWQSFSPSSSNYYLNARLPYERLVFNARCVCVRVCGRFVCVRVCACVLCACVLCVCVRACVRACV